MLRFAGCTQQSMLCTRQTTDESVRFALLFVVPGVIYTITRSECVQTKCVVNILKILPMHDGRDDNPLFSRTHHYAFPVARAAFLYLSLSISVSRSLSALLL